MRHHFHRCPNLLVLTADASDLHGARHGGHIALDELCRAKGLVPCLGLIDCDVLVPGQKRTLLVARATLLRAEEGGESSLADVAPRNPPLAEALGRQLVAERARIVTENRRLTREVASLLDVARDGNSDEVDRGDAAAALRFDGTLEQLCLRRLDAIDRALDGLAQGTFGTCLRCRATIEPDRLRALPDASLCISCARAAELRA